MKHQLYCTILIALAILSLSANAQTPPAKTQPSPAKTQTQTPPALSAIRQQDIKTDIFAMAGDHFRGREAGTLDELKVAAWVADKAKEAGLRPGGDDGTYFQFFSMWRNRLSPLSTISIDDHTFPLWTDAI